MLLLLIFLKITFFLSNVAALNITVQPETVVGQSSLVIWQREPSDNDDELVFDLRFVQPGSIDVGLAVSNIQAPSSAQFGTVEVVFPSQGLFQLWAVSGPNDTILGKSNQVNAIVVPTTSVPPTPTSTSQPSATTSVQPTSTSPASSGVHHKKNLGAIIGGTLGGVALGLLVTLVIAFLRCRRPEHKRWTFHQDMMVRPAADSVIDIRSTSPAPVDIEQGLPHDDEPVSPVIMIASPSGPRPLLKPNYRALPVLPEPLNGRQEDMVERMKELEGNPGPTQHIMLDDMQKQINWLQSQMGSILVIESKDVVPVGLDHDLAEHNAGAPRHSQGYTAVPQGG